MLRLGPSCPSLLARLKYINQFTGNRKVQDVSCTFYPVSPNNSTLYSSSTIHNQEIDINTIHGAYSEFTSVTCLLGAGILHIE